MKNSKLKGRIVEKFGNAQSFAEALGVSPTKISFLLNGKREWRVSLMAKAIYLLDIPKEDFDIFFLNECLAVGEDSDVDA